jgi:hypothetical protein
VALVPFLSAIVALRVAGIRRLFEEGREVEASVRKVKRFRGGSTLKLEFELNGIRYKVRSSASGRARAAGSRRACRSARGDGRPARSQAMTEHAVPLSPVTVVGSRSRSRSLLDALRVAGPRTGLMLLGFASVLTAWQLTTAVWQLPLFEKITPPAPAP